MERRTGTFVCTAELSDLFPLASVIYNGCPRAFEAGIWWPQTKFGQPAAVPCPKGSVGKSCAWVVLRIGNQMDTGFFNLGM